MVLVSSVVSLMPVTKMKDKLINGDKEKKIKSTDNLWFYGDIIKYNIDEYKKALADRGISSFSSIYEQLVSQIIINAHIASKKYACFKVSSYSIVLTFLHQEVGPFCPFHGKNFINASINRYNESNFKAVVKESTTYFTLDIQADL